MLTPATPTETIPSRRFRPSYCPHTDCTRHRPPVCSSLRFRRYGFFSRLCDGRRIQRFLCLHCRRTFSQQSFATSYWLKRPDLTEPIARGLCAGSAHRQLARSLDCSPTTAMRRATRLGRHALLLHQLLLRERGELAEPVVLDDFESFTGSQFFPFGLGTAVGWRSWLIYSLGHAPHGRGGRLTGPQRRRWSRMQRRGAVRARPGGYVRACSRHLDLLLERAGRGRLRLISDGHNGYRSAVAGHPDRERIAHEVHPNPKRGPKGSRRSPEAIARDRAMFPVDTLHRMIRHSLSHHRRETIAFGRREEAQMERGFLLAVWLNLVKRRSERLPVSRGARTAAMEAGLTARRWDWGDVLAVRLQPSRVPGRLRWMEVYRREMTTRAALGRPLPRHELRYAF